MDRKEGAELLHDDTLTDERETQICACVRACVRVQAHAGVSEAMKRDISKDV